MSIVTKVAIRQILKIQLNFAGYLSFSGNEWKMCQTNMLKNMLDLLNFESSFYQKV